MLLEPPGDDPVSAVHLMELTGWACLFKGGCEVSGFMDVSGRGGAHLQL